MLTSDIKVRNPNKTVVIPCPNAPNRYKYFTPITVPSFAVIGDEKIAAKNVTPNEKPY